MTAASANPVNSTKDQNNSQEENKAPTTQVSANLFNTGPNTGNARVTNRATTTTTTKTMSAVFMAVLLWWMYLETSRILSPESNGTRDCLRGAPPMAMSPNWLVETPKGVCRGGFAPLPGA